MGKSFFPQYTFMLYIQPMFATTITLFGLSHPLFKQFAEALIGI
jgi:hypothetical protein